MRNFLGYFIGLVWLINGLFCKVLHLVPRHQQIIASILGEKYDAFFTVAIGLAETVMFIWIISKIQSQLCTWVQVAVVAAMNIIEFIAVPQLLLFGKLNLVFACIFIAVVLYNQYGSFSKTSALSQ